MRLTGVAAVLVLLCPALAAGDASVGVGGGVLIGGDVSDGVGRRGEGNAGLLTGVRLQWTPSVAVTSISIGPDVLVARWTTDVSERDGTLVLVGGRLVRGTDDAGLYLAARIGMWTQRDRPVVHGGFGGYSHPGRQSRVRIGWEIGAAGWREDPMPIVPGVIAPTFRAPAGDAPDERGGTFPFLGVHGWFELAVDL